MKLRALPSALVVVGFAAACGVALALGFDHVSDDDYARVTIAQSFAHHPQLDPSGTSWLPFPFWALGSAMAIFGRSLLVARTVSIALASLAALLPYHALRCVGVAPRRALLAVAFGMLSPWSVWLGAATVPESFVASATAAAAIAVASGSVSERARLGFGAAMLAACLSRYEPWPVAAVLGVVLAWQAVRSRSPVRAAAAAIVVAGPLLWMAWNVHAHGEALHFFVRVSRFKQALGEGSTDTLTALLLYPRLLVFTRPDIVVALCLAFAAARTAVVRAALRRTWAVPTACVAAQLAFLAYGNARDGAPAHHAERALVAAFVILAALAVDALGESFDRAAAPEQRLSVVAAAVVAVASIVTSVHLLGDTPGRGPSEDRSAQLARGRLLREEGAASIVVGPCAFEHFALVAAFEAPESVTTLPRANTPVLPTCPSVERR